MPLQDHFRKANLDTLGWPPGTSGIRLFTFFREGRNLGHAGGNGRNYHERMELLFFEASAKTRQCFYMKFEAADHDEYYESIFVEA